MNVKRVVCPGCNKPYIVSNDASYSSCYDCGITIFRRMFDRKHEPYTLEGDVEGYRVLQNQALRECGLVGSGLSRLVVALMLLVVLSVGGMAQTKIRPNVAPSLDGALTILTMNLLDNATDTTFALRLKKSVTFDIGVKRRLVFTVRTDSIFMPDSAVVLNWKSVDANDSTYELTTRRLKRGDRPAWSFARDSITVWTEIEKVTKTQCRVRLFTTRHPLFPDQIVIIRKGQ